MEKTIKDAILNMYKYDEEARIKGMVKILDKVKYISFGNTILPTENERKRRAFAYALSITAINDIGAGADNQLMEIKQAIAILREICVIETGYLVDSYATELVGSNYGGWKKNPYKREYVKKT